MRICSLLPSATEIAYALGLGDEIVGVTHECDFPPAARAKPVLIRPRLDATASAGEIDREVRELVARSESLYAVDAELLRRLAPDLILTQDLCHVCAASPEDLASALARFERAPRVLTLAPHSLEGVWSDIRAVGQATGRSEAGERLAAELEARVAAVERAVAGLPRPRVVCLEWLDPLFVAGHWVPEMVAKAGGDDVLGRPSEPSFTVSWQQVLDARPDFVLVMPCGYGMEKAAAEFAGLSLPPGWDELPAAREGRVFAVDASSYFSRPGPRLANGVENLGRILHPERLGPATAEHARRMGQ
jgi:iron complex transport system substrate-binding protein